MMSVGHPKLKRNKIILIGNAGQELINETEYEVAGTVMDNAGNETDVSITFVTK